MSSQRRGSHPEIGERSDPGLLEREPVDNVFDTDDVDDRVAVGARYDDLDCGDLDYGDSGSDDSGVAALAVSASPSRGSRNSGRRRRMSDSRRGRAYERRYSRQNPESRRPVHGFARLLWLLVGIACTIGFVLAAYFSPVLGVRHFDIHGLKGLNRSEVLARAGVPLGTPLLRVSGKSVAESIARLPRVDHVVVERQFPNTLVIDVTERVPVAYIKVGKIFRIVDRNGVAFIDQSHMPTDIPAIEVKDFSPDDDVTRSALAVVSALPRDIFSQVARVQASSPADVTLVLKDKRIVVWGDASKMDEKARNLRVVLSQPGHWFNLSGPGLPAVK